jgi:hypothetical protein
MEELDRLFETIEEVKISLEVDIEDLEGDLEALENKILYAEESANELGVDASSIDNFPFALQTYEDALSQIEKGKNYLNKL